MENEPVDKLFIVLRGKVANFTLNPDLENLEWASTMYENLKKWKNEEFNLKLKREIQKVAISNKLITDIRQIIKLNKTYDQRQDIESEASMPVEN